MEFLSELRRVLDEAPSAGGGRAIIVATGSAPPALALVSTNSAAVDGHGAVRLAVQAESSAARRLGGSATLLVPDDAGAMRVYVPEATARLAGAVAVIEGSIGSIDRTAEPPWALRLEFERRDGDPAGRAEQDLRYWASLRSWLAAGAPEGPPPLPAPRRRQSPERIRE